jgi:hypothetical protein
MVAHDFTHSPPYEHELSVHPAQCMACQRRPSAEAPPLDVQAAAVAISSTALPPKVTHGGEPKPTPPASVHVKIDAATIYARRASSEAVSKPPEVSQPAKPTIDATAIYAARAEQSKLSTARSWGAVLDELNRRNAGLTNSIDPNAIYAKRRADIRTNRNPSPPANTASP